jgi:hypothetical protein
VLSVGDFGLWDTSLPVCTLDNCSPPVISNDVRIITGSYRVGNSLVFTCPDGYIISGNATSTCDASGVWTSNVPDCKSML